MRKMILIKMKNNIISKTEEIAMQRNKNNGTATSNVIFSNYNYLRSINSISVSFPNAKKIRI